VNRRLRRGAAVAALALALSATGAGCSAGFDPPVLLVEPDNVNAEVGDLLLRALVLVKAEGAESAALVGALVNRGETDTLTKVEIAGQGTALSFSPNLEVPGGKAVMLGGSEGEAITITGAKDLMLGTFVPVTLTFRNAGSTQVKLLVEDAEDFYEPYAPPGAPTPTATPAGTESPEAAEPTETASP
jgi:copper(I)-binding protein